MADGGEQRAHADFVGSTPDVPAARRFVNDTLRRWSVDEALTWSAALAVTELATNAVVHAVGMFGVTLRIVDDAVRVEVLDSSPRRPRPRHYSDVATTGRGLALVASLAEQWGAIPTAEGKSVWCLLRPAESTSDDEPDLDAFLLADDLAVEPIARPATSGTARTRADTRDRLAA